MMRCLLNFKGFITIIRIIGLNSGRGSDCQQFNLHITIMKILCPPTKILCPPTNEILATGLVLMRFFAN